MRKMSGVPHELIRQVQISTRAAAGLSNYNPSDPTLPVLPPLSAEIAAAEPSPPDLRCKNCKGRLLRGSESIICVYCGRGPHYDAVPEPICFASTIGYRWLLRSLRLDGSEMVDPTNKREQHQGPNSPKALTPLSDFLNFKLLWPAETEKQETSFLDKYSEESKRSLSLTGVAPDKFFLNSNRNVLSDTSIEQSFMHNLIGAAAPDNQNLFQNIQSSEPADSSSKHRKDIAFSEWEADFQSADSENQLGGYKSSEHFAGSSADSGNKFQDSKSFDHSKVLEVDLAAHIDSVFGPAKDLNDATPKDTPSVSPAFDDWTSDEMWNNLSSKPKETHFSGEFDVTVSGKNDSGSEHTLEYSKDLSISADLFQDFQSQSSKESHFTSGFDVTVSTKNDPGSDNKLEYSKDLSTSVDLLQDFGPQSNMDMTENRTMNEEHKTIDEDSFEEWNDFTGSTSLQDPFQNAWSGSNNQVLTSDQKLSEIDLLGFADNKFEGDVGSFSQPDLFSASTSNSNALAEVNVSDNPASNWLTKDSNTPHESRQAANDEDASGKSTNDDVRMLISQMHDLSFMLEPNLSIPSDSQAHNSPPKD